MANTQFEPMRDLIVMEINQTPKESQEGGLFYQAPRWAKPENVGKALQVGPSVMTVEVDQLYLINPYAVIDTEIDNVKLVREGDILCRILPTDQ